MFVGHYGVSFAVKRVAPTIPLWALFIAVQLLDVFWAPFILPRGAQRDHQRAGLEVQAKLGLGRHR
jgi:hypothetical protein